MAAASIDKMTTAQVAATFNHSNDRKEDKTHTNPDIQPELADENVFIDSRSPRKLMSDFKKDISATDALEPPKNLRKDRITGLGVIVNYPRDLTEDDIIRKKVLDKDGKEKELIYIKPEVKAEFIDFCKQSIPEIEKQLNGKAYGAVIHFDEVHEYLDPETKKLTISRPHMHLIVPARAEILEKTGEKDNKGKEIYKHTGRYRINGRDALQRTTYNKVNGSLDDICLDTFGYTYRDGSKKHAPKKSIDELKRASSDALQKEIDKKNNKLQSLRNDLKNLENSYQEKEKELSTELSTLQNDIKTTSKTYQDKKDELTALHAEIDKKTQSINRIKKEVNDLQTDISDLKDKRSILVEKATSRKSIPIHKDWKGKEYIKLSPDEYNALMSEHEEVRSDKVKLSQEREALETDKAQLERDKTAFRQEKARQKYQAEGQYKEDAQKYKDMLKGAKSKDEIKKMIDDDMYSLSDISREIRLYALTQSEGEKNGLLKAVNAVDTLENYILKSFNNRPKDTVYEWMETVIEYQEKISNMYKQILDFDDRSKMYSKISELWTDVKAEKKQFWSKHTPNKQTRLKIDNIDKHVGGAVVQALQEYQSMVDEIQEEYDR